MVASSSLNENKRQVGWWPGTTGNESETRKSHYQVPADNHTGATVYATPKDLLRYDVAQQGHRTKKEFLNISPISELGHFDLLTVAMQHGKPQEDMNEGNPDSV